MHPRLAIRLWVSWHKNLLAQLLAQLWVSWHKNLLRWFWDKCQSKPHPLCTCCMLHPGHFQEQIQDLDLENIPRHASKLILWHFYLNCSVNGSGCFFLVFLGLQWRWYILAHILTVATGPMLRPCKPSILSNWQTWSARKWITLISSKAVFGEGTDMAWGTLNLM